jgi:predicted kinase
MKASTIEAIASEYVQRLEFLGVDNPKLHISFSAVPGSGKTTLARRLSKDLKAHYIQSDEVRRMLSAKHEEVNSDIVRTITAKIIEYILKEDTNQCIIIDASIDRSWPTFYEFAAKCEAKTFIIRLDIPTAIVRQRLLERDGAINEEKMRNFRSDFDAGKQNIPADIELGTDYNYGEILAVVKARLAALK